MKRRKSFPAINNEFELKLQKRQPFPTDDILIKEGKHKIYSQQHGNKIGEIEFISNNDNYTVNLTTEEFSEDNNSTKSKELLFNEQKFYKIPLEHIKNKCQWSYTFIPLEDQQNLLVGKINDKVILIYKYKGVTFIPDSITSDYREYYFFELISEETYNYILNNIMIEDFNDFFDTRDKAFSRGIFYEDINQSSSSFR